MWVNRSKAFDEKVKSVGDSLTREEAWDMLERFFGSCDRYLAPAKGPEDESSETQREDKAKDLVQKAGQWLSSRFGTGTGADFSRMARVYKGIEQWAGKQSPGAFGTDAIARLAAALSEFHPPSSDLKGVLDLIKGPGYKSATRNLLTQIDKGASVTQEDLGNLLERARKDCEKCTQKSGSKGQRAYADAILKDVEAECGFTYRVDKDSQPVSVKHYSQYNKSEWGPANHRQFAVMLDHAARRVSLGHTWIKRAEAERHWFEENAKKKEQVPANIKKWLDDFCSERSQASGALEPYRIRRRAVNGWNEVVAAWSKPNCKTREDRIAAARALQDDPEIEKFGDIQLFEALAEDDAVCVWHQGGDAAKDPDPQLLIDYALVEEAEFKKRRFKVPAYRHPHALLHPVFCDFGCSRWGIDFSIHRTTTKREDANKFSHISRMEMKLFNGTRVTKTELCWQSKKLVQDLALRQDASQTASVQVSRADRLGRAASNATTGHAVKIAGLFEQKDWNGRLQAPRQQLDAIARQVQKSGWDQKAKKMRDNLQWFVTFSAKLQPHGPWCEFAKKNGLSADPKYRPHADENETRKGHARLILSRLPGLRVLSVDLGHRYAAACAVWEAVNVDQVKKACQLAGHEAPKASDLYLHLKRKTTKQKKGNQVLVQQTTIYRRIAADTFPNGAPHPAPWARLDRQFLIKLQGEQEGVREASNEEIWKVHQLDVELGRAAPLIDRLVSAGWGCSGRQRTRLNALRELGWKEGGRGATSEGLDEDQGEVRKPSLSVDELMSSAVRTMRLALKRHGDRARIAFAMNAEYKPMPGDHRYYFTEAKGLSANDSETARTNRRIEFVQDALIMWHGLGFSRGWQDDEAKQLWEKHVASLPQYKALEDIEEESTRSERKAKQKGNWDKLRDVAQELVNDASLRQALHDVWKERWKKDDDQWKKRLRWFRDWILPRGKAAKNLAIRKVGGLSLPRLATLTEFRRKVQVGFFTRLHPDGTRAETKEQFGQSALDALEHLREQRVKQLASRIAEAALGVGSENGKGWDGRKRPRQRISDPRFAPCHAIVIEYLTHYRPEETRTRRENRQLMAWSSSKVKKYLAEACQLYGLHLREISAAYTSRQDSRTGAPGVRCQDVPIDEFMRSPFWRKQVKQAEAKQSEQEGDAREQFLCDLNALWKDKTGADWQMAGAVRVPLKGGEIFVSADPDSPAAKGIQADLNAAANIGLRALTDPDWPGRWWYVPCDSHNYTPLEDRVGGSHAEGIDKPLKAPPDQQQSDNAAKDKNKPAKKSANKSKQVVNLWRDVSSSPLNYGKWKEYAAYQKEVQYKLIRILRKQMEVPDRQPYKGKKGATFPCEEDARYG